MATYNHDSIVPFKGSDAGKKQQIASMFDRIAFRYDFLNRFLSGGIDIYWRKRTIRELVRPTPSTGPATASSPRPASSITVPLSGRSATSPSASASPATTPANPRTILDVATGTADMAIMMTRHLHPEKVTGIDISTGMLEIGRQKIAKAGMQDLIELRTGDSEAIQFPDNSFDAITVAFGVRNFENLEKGLGEMLRVLNPGGRLAILEFSQPKTPGISQLYKLYLRLVAPGIGKMLSSSREAYQYLNDSVQAFPEGPSLVRILDQVGYHNTRFRRLSLGICTIYIGEKSGS